MRLAFCLYLTLLRNVLSKLSLISIVIIFFKLNQALRKKQETKTKKRSNVLSWRPGYTERHYTNVRAGKHYEVDIKVDTVKCLNGKVAIV